MNKASFINECVAFGPYPTQQDIDELEDNGFVHFIDLTSHLERGVSPYHTRFNRVKFPIKDQSVPYDFKSFCSFIYCVLDLIRKGGKIYIHCKGGHGRSITVVACILFFLCNITADDALVRASEYHNTRKELKTKWLPYTRHQTLNQRSFVKRVCKYCKVV